MGIYIMAYSKTKVKGMAVNLENQSFFLREFLFFRDSILHFPGKSCIIV